MAGRTKSLFVVAIGLGAAACGSPRGGGAATPPPAAVHQQPVERASTAAPETAPPAPAETAETLVAVVDPVELRRLEAAGFDFGRLVASSSAATTRDLRALPALKPLFDTLAADVRAAARPFPLARVTSVDGFRLFDERWLASSEMRFELTGVFNRLDRRAFYDGTCGEVRFLYRLSYATSQGGKPMASRLPMTMNVVFLVDGGADTRCTGNARSWQAPASLSGEAVTKWLLADGALSPASRGAWRLKSVESNLQTFRLQSSVHPSMAGHIEYGLRVFHSDAKIGFFPAPMENMPDVAVIARSPGLRAELLAHLKKPEVLADVDRGTLQLPERFLSTQAVSFSPRGLSRIHNRPFKKLFDEKDFAGVPLDAYQTIRSPAALLRRLDAASCVGCHQSRSIAGFHHVGLDPIETPTFNSLLSGSSSHLSGELARRRSYVEAIAAGAEPSEFRPFPEHQGSDGKEGAPCGLGDPGFAGWTCAAGFSCTRLEDVEVGVCLAEGMIGAPCEYGTMTKNARPHRDQISAMQSHACGAAQTCDTNFQGFPLGACGARCDSHLPGSSCADFLDVDGFQNCLRSKGAFDRCAKEFVFGVAAAECDSQHACRQDYVCARTRSAGTGACVPPYFVYQLRLDGYPIMR